MDHILINLLKQTELFRDLDDEILNFLAGRAVERRLERDRILFLAGEAASGLYVLIKGSVRA